MVSQDSREGTSHNLLWAIIQITSLFLTRETGCRQSVAVFTLPAKQTHSGDDNAASPVVTGHWFQEQRQGWDAQSWWRKHKNRNDTGRGACWGRSFSKHRVGAGEPCVVFLKLR